MKRSEVVNIGTPRTRDGSYDAETTRKLRLEAMGIVPQLPQEESEALAVLNYCKDLITGFLKR